MSKISNTKGVSIVLGASILDNTYDYNNDPMVISATTIMKPIKPRIRTIQGHNIDLNYDIMDLTDNFAGSAMHEKVEHTWLRTKNYKKGLKKLGIKNKIIKRIVVNPNKVSKKDIPIYLELRGHLKIKYGYTLSGKNDYIVYGVLYDLKNTGSFKYNKFISEKYLAEGILRSKSNSFKKLKQLEKDCPVYFEYQMQLSIYKLIHKKIITTNHAFIEFYIKDWMSYMADSGIPNRIIIEKFTLFKRKDTTKWVTSRLKEHKKYITVAKQKNLPNCKDSELWMTKEEYKYFTNPNNKRATKIFNQDAKAAYKYLEKQGKGVIKIIPAVAKKCLYCSHLVDCKQARKLVKQGILTLGDRNK